MPDAPVSYHLDRFRLILSPSGDMRLLEVTPTFYEDLGEHVPDFTGQILIQQGEFSDPWPTWEIHPKGDEFVYLLSGDVDFVLWEDGKETVIRVNQDNHYVVVPKNTWHTARPRSPTKMLFVTPGEGTLNAEKPG